MYVWIVIGAAVLFSLGSLLWTMCNRPDRKVRRRLRSCARRIRATPRRITALREELRFCRSEAYLDHARVNGVKLEWHFFPVKAGYERGLHELRHDRIGDLDRSLEDARFNLRRYLVEWREASSRYRTQLTLAHGTEALREEVARRNRAIVDLQERMAQEVAIRSGLERQLSELEAQVTYRDAPPLPKVRVEPVVEEIEELLERLDQKERGKEGEGVLN